MNQKQIQKSIEQERQNIADTIVEAIDNILALYGKIASSTPSGVRTRQYAAGTDTDSFSGVSFSMLVRDDGSVTHRARSQDFNIEVDNQLATDVVNEQPVNKTNTDDFIYHINRYLSDPDCVKWTTLADSSEQMSSDFEPEFLEV